MIARVGCALLNVNHVLQRRSVEIACYVIKLINPKIIISYSSLSIQVVHTYEPLFGWTCVRSTYIDLNSQFAARNSEVEDRGIREDGRKDGRGGGGEGN